MKRFLLTLLCAVLLLGLLAGCTQGATTTATTKPVQTSGSTTTTTAGTTTQPDIRYEISYFSFWVGELDDGSPVEKIIEDALNIDIKVKKVNHANAEAVNLMLSSGEMPDCGWFSGKDPQFMYYEQELSRAIPRSMVEQYAPDFVAEYDKSPILWAYALDKDDNQSLLCMPGKTETYTNLYLWADFYRYDWLKAAGVDLGVSTTKISDNLYLADAGIKLDAWTAALTAFVSQGKIGAVSFDAQLLAPAFDLNWNQSVDIDGKTVMYYTTDTYKAFLKAMAARYQQGLFDQEILTQNRNAAWEKINAGNAGYFASSTNTLNSWAIDRPPLTLFEKEPAVELLMTPGLANQAGQYGVVSFTSPMYSNFYVNATVTDEGKLARILEFIQYANFGETLASHWMGEEGIDWSYDSSGAPKKIAPLMAGVKGTQAFCLFMQVRDAWEWLTFEPLFTKGAGHYVASYNGIWNKHLRTPGRIDPLNETNLAAVNAEVGGNLNSVRSTYYQDAILGLIDVDATWDRYLADLNTAGYARYLTELSKAPTYTELLARYE
jgi:hypothetical protein